jgi:hypothetical protein
MRKLWHESVRVNWKKMFVMKDANPALFLCFPRKDMCLALQLAKIQWEHRMKASTMDAQARMAADPCATWLHRSGDRLDSAY